MVAIVDATGAGTAGLLERAAQRFEGHVGVERFHAAEGSIVFVAVDDDEPVGWCWGYHLPRPDGTSMLYLHEVDVAETQRRQGIGRALVEAFIACGHHAGARKMFLVTEKANGPARRLYDQLGGALAASGPTVTYWFDLTSAATEN